MSFLKFYGLIIYICKLKNSLLFHFKPLNFALSFLTHHRKPKASPKHTNTDQRHANF